MNSYARGGQPYGNGNSYVHGGSYMDGGNSYMYYDPRYENSMYSMARGGRGYSMTGSKEEVMEELQKMMGETHDEKVRLALTEAIGKMNK
jgi:hypothetical protein